MSHSIHLQGVWFDLPDSKGAGGTTTTSNTARIIFRKADFRERLINSVPEDFREDYQKLVENIALICNAVQFVSTQK